jgi:tRNA pseudouridine38-40 synthase
MRFALAIAYDGRPYEGWQSQRGGNTVQDHLLAALQKIDPEIAQVHGSGRTDSGVSAEGQVAHFDASAGSSLDAEAWQRALNTKLPKTIRVMASREVDNDFHARYSAIGKVYRYRLWLDRVLPPLEHGLAWRVRPSLDVDHLRTALDLLHGEHDFRAFAANRGDGKDADRDCLRNISSITVEPPANGTPLLTLHFDGNGFLYKMVRLLVGTAVRHAEHPEKLSLVEIGRLLTSPEANEKAPFCAPADGLSLISVHYPTASGIC